MLGIVAAMGAGSASPNASPPPPPSTASGLEAAPIPAGDPVVVIDPEVAAPVPVVVEVTAVSNQPIQVTANPVVVAPASAPAQAPVAATNGSR
jgi:hypothetical protein